MFGLLINPQPQRDESLLGYLQRLAGANGLAGDELIKAFEQAEAGDIAAWFSRFEPPVSWSSVSEELRQPKTKTLKVWSLRHKRYCACCLAESAYWKETWDLTLVTTCSLHGVQLQDRCPGCSVKINHGAMLANSCKSCGYLLTEQTVEIPAADSHRAWMTTALEARLSKNFKHGHSGLDALTYEQLHVLSSRLAVRSVRSESTKPLKVAGSGSLEVSRHLAQAAGQVLMNWPGAFRDMLSDLRDARSDGKDWKLTSAFGPLYRDIHHELEAPCFDFVRSEFESYVKDAWQAPLSKRNRYLSEKTIQGHRWVSIEEAARLTGLLRSFVERLHDHGELESREIAHSSGRKLKVVDVAQLRELSLRMQGSVNMRQAAQLLHINLDRVRQLIGAGMLRFHGGRPKPGENWLIDVDSINSLRPKNIQPAMDNDFVTVNYLAKHHLPAGGGLVELIKAIQTGQLQAFSDGDNNVMLGHWLVKTQALKKWMRNVFQNPSDFPGITICKAAILLGVKQEVAYALVRQGILWSTPIKSGRRTLQMVLPKAIERFRRRYILGPELSVFLGLPPKHVMPHLWENGFRPVAGPSIVKSPCRQYVWPRSKKLVDYLSWKAAHY
ncbi:TniQ family protein [Pseudomonas sp. LB3P81]